MPGARDANGVRPADLGDDLLDRRRGDDPPRATGDVARPVAPAFAHPVGTSWVPAPASAPNSAPRAVSRSSSSETSRLWASQSRQTPSRNHSQALTAARVAGRSP